MSAFYAIISTAAAPGESDNTSSPFSSSYRRYHNSCCRYTLVHYHPFITATSAAAAVFIVNVYIIFGVFLNNSSVSREHFFLLPVFSTSVLAIDVVPTDDVGWQLLLYLSHYYRYSSCSCVVSLLLCLLSLAAAVA